MNKENKHTIFAVVWMVLAFVALVVGADSAYVAMGVICSVINANAS